MYGEGEEVLDSGREAPARMSGVGSPGSVIIGRLKSNAWLEICVHLAISQGGPSGLRQERKYSRSQSLLGGAPRFSGRDGVRREEHAGESMSEKANLGASQKLLS